MTTATFSSTQAAELLALAGVSTPAEPEVTTEVIVEHDDDAAALADILVKCKGVQDTGYALVDAHLATRWERTKMSKVQAARAGLDSASAHNVPAWKAHQALREQMRTEVRTHCRQGEHVRPTIAASKGKTPKRSPEVDAFLLKHADDTTVQALAALLGL